MNTVIRGAGRPLLLLLGGALGACLMGAAGTCVPADLGDTVEFPYQTHVFDHAAHMSNACELCHHTGAEGMSCDATGCHQADSVGGVPNLKDAKHQTCFTCHNEQTADGSRRCSFCHTDLAG